MKQQPGRRADHRNAAGGPGATPDESAGALTNVPPHDFALEEAVLGALMIDRDGLLSVADILTPDVFYSDANAMIFSAIRDLFADGNPVDILTVTNALRNAGVIDKVGGAHYIVDMTNRIGSAANIEYHARILCQHYMLRCLIDSCQQGLRSAYDRSLDPFTALEMAEQSLIKIWDGLGGASAQRIGHAAALAARSAEAALLANGVSGVPSGFDSIDRITGGWQDGNLIIIAARPGMGKSALSMNMAHRITEVHRMPVAVFSLEMSAEELAMRILCDKAELSGDDVRTARITEGDTVRIRQAAAEVNDLPLYVDDSPGLSVYKMLSAARRLKAKHGIRLIIVDYLQLMEAGDDRRRGSNQTEDITMISRGLKLIAKTLRVPVIALSQLSRAPQLRADKRPMLSDLRGSGAIEQDADLVAFIHRDEYYGIKNDETGADTSGVAEFIVAKHRNGKVGTERLKWDEKRVRFLDMQQPAPGVLKDYSAALPQGVRPPADADIPF